MKKLLLLLTVFASVSTSFAQTFTQRTNGTFTPVDPYLSVPRALYIPKVCDTLISPLHGGKDSIGAIMYDTCNHKLWIRDIVGTTRRYREIGSGVTNDLSYIYSSTVPTGSDISKLWVRTPTKAGVYDVLYLRNNQWERYGWLDSCWGVFTFRPPYNLVGDGQSNSVGIGTGGDTSMMRGIIAWSSNTVFLGGGMEYQTVWVKARIGFSPFLTLGGIGTNNIAFQVAKNIIKSGKADIVRIIQNGDGGQNLAKWIGTSGAYLRDSLRNRLNASGIDTITAFLWHQGESGGVTGFNDGGMVVDLRTLWDTLVSPLTKGFIKNYTKFIAGGLFENPRANLNRGSAQAALEGLNYDGNPYTGFVSAEGLGDIDGTHFSGTALDTFGVRYNAQIWLMPHTTSNEEAPFTWNNTYDKRPYVATITRILDYNGGPGASINVGAGFRLTDNSNNTVLSIMQGPSSVRIGAAYGSAARSFTVLGTTSILEGNYNLNISTDYNPSGSPEHCTFITNHSSNFTLSGSNDAVIIGYNAGATTNHQPGNSVIVGSEAFYNSTPSGFGDIITGVGWQAGHGSAGLGLTFVGGRAGKNAAGSYLTALGMDAGATATTGWTNSTAIGANAKWDGDSVLVLGAALKRVYFGGNGVTIKFKTDVAPTNGQSYKYNSTSGLMEFSSTVVGTISNDNAAAGDVGEFIESNITSGSAVSLTTATATNITSISLTAGDWDVEGIINYSMSGTTTTNFQSGSNSTSATFGGDNTYLYTPFGVAGFTDVMGQILPKRRFSLASTTTVYLIGQSTFSVGTTTAYGNIRARRVR